MKTLTRLWIALWLVLAFAFQASAQEVCYNIKTGAMRVPVRIACRKTEAPLSLASKGVVDSAGRAVGPYDVPSGTVLVQAEGLWFSLPIGPQGYGATPATAIFYSGPDCTGDAYFQPPTGLVVAPEDMGIFDGNLYYPGPTMQMVTWQSLASSPFADANSCDNIAPQTGNVAPMESTPLSDLGFVPPFKLQ